jgi:hypothetical protein
MEKTGVSDKRDNGGMHGIIPADEVTSTEAQQKGRKQENKTISR